MEELIVLCDCRVCVCLLGWQRVVNFSVRFGLWVEQIAEFFGPSWRTWYSRLLYAEEENESTLKPGRIQIDVMGV